MVCAACGCEQVAGQFCRQCGARQAVPPPFPFEGEPQAYMPLGAMPAAGVPYAAMQAERQRMRVRQNLQPLGITWILLGVYRLLTGLVGAVMMHSFATSGMFGDAPPFLPHLFHMLIPVIAATMLVMSAGSFVTGYALLARKSWARTLAIVVAILSLVKLPFGTAVGIYTLWVLAPRASWAEWETISREV